MPEGEDTGMTGSVKEKYFYTEVQVLRMNASTHSRTWKKNYDIISKIVP